MTIQEYMDEHWHDLPGDGFAEEQVLGECEVCGVEVTSLDAAFSGTEHVYEPVYEHGVIVGVNAVERKMYLHDECIEEYVSENVTHDQLAEFLELKKI